MKTERDARLPGAAPWNSQVRAAGRLRSGGQKKHEVAFALFVRGSRGLVGRTLEMGGVICSDMRPPSRLGTRDLDQVALPPRS